MRRLAIASLALLTLACDPTGNTAPDFDSARFRFANFAVDATGLAVARGGNTLANNVTFATISAPVDALTGQAILVTRRLADNFELGRDTVTLVKDRRYTYYGLGEVTAYVPLLAQQDTVPPTGGQYKVRFIHGVGTESSFTLDFFADTAADLTGVTPTYPGLSYGTAGLYVAVDTNVRRFRWTRNGVTTPLLDTTFSASIPAGAIVTFVVTNLQGSSASKRVTRVNDSLP